MSHPCGGAKRLSISIQSIDSPSSILVLRISSFKFTYQEIHSNIHRKLDTSSPKHGAKTETAVAEEAEERLHSAGNE